jgi:hypothetical protein
VAIQPQNDDGEAGKPATPEQNAPPLTGTGASRRRFAKAGAGLSGVLLTLTSQPGMACSICTSPSGSLSGGLKSRHGPPVTCTGLSPGYWKTHSSWPSGCSKTTTFGNIFPCSASHKTYRDITCQGLLTHQDFDKNNLGMHLVAAYLNVKARRSTFITEQTLVAIWSEWQQNGFYRPTATKKWYGYDIVLYLSGTMD